MKSSTESLDRDLRILEHQPAPPSSDASDDARLAQRTLDWLLRPRSYECWPEAVDFVPRRRVGDLCLPGEPKRTR
jgi:hypothetical protein